jgi:hypothetical protein
VYEAEVRGPQPGNYIVNLFVGEGSAARAGPTANPAAGAPGGVVHLVTGGASRPPGEELRVFASNRANLEAVAEASGGRMLDAGDPRSADLYSRESLVATASIRPLWRPLLVLLLAVFLLDVAVRRIAWDWASTWRWLVQRLDQWAGLLRPREVSAGATMAALKTKARQVERKLAAPPAPNPTQAAVKFEAQPGAVAQADFAAAVGAARVPPPAAATPPQPPGGGAGAEGATTAHLLEAKRRAQQRLPGGAENP